MDDPTLRDLLARNQEGMAGASILSLFFSASYVVIKQFDLWRSLQGAAVGALFSATLWLFLQEFLHLALFFIVPVAAGCGYGAFPLVKAWARKDDAIADDVVVFGSGLLTRLLKIFGGKP